ncbi:MAG: PAS domain S-box protein [Armatimonadota bacterium]|nr:PAS domain S-box protein [bacterium]
MSKRSDAKRDWSTLRDKIIGLGESSASKSYYPELQRRLADLERFRALLDQSNDAILLAKLPSGQLVDWNESTCNILDYTNADLVNMTIYDIADTSAWKKVSELLSAEASAAPTTLTTSLRKRDGSLIPTEMTVVVMSIDGHTYAAAVARDITERNKAEQELARYRERLEELVVDRTADLRRANDQLRQEIAERERAEEALRDSERKYRQIYESFYDVYFRTSVDGRIEIVSPSIQQHAGYDPEWLVGRPVTDVYYNAKDRQFFLDMMLAKGEVENYEMRLKTLDGQPVDMLVNARLRRKPDGTPEAIEGVLHDITDRKRAEEALRESEERYRTLVEQALDGIFLADSDGRYIDVNPSGAAMLGYSRDEILSMHISDIVRPEELDRLAVHISNVKRGDRTITEWDLKRKDGSYITTELSAVQLQNGNIQAIVRDITERKRAEEELQKYRDHLEDLVEQRTGELREEQEFTSAILYTSTAIVIVLGPDGKIVRFNRAAEQLTGYSQDEVYGRYLWDLLAPEQIWQVKSLFEELTSGKFPIQFESHIVGKDGSRRLIAWSSTSLLDADGKTKYVIDTGIDITERERAEENRRNFEKQIEAQKRQFYKDTILSVTSGKLDICDAADVRPYISASQIKEEVCGPDDVGYTRRQAQQFCEEHGLVGDRLHTFMVGVGEAITNAVKHAGSGRVYAGTIDGSVWVGVADRGKGIESLILPKATLLRGFSTKPSMGLGYSIMLEVSDQVLLKTGPHGTTVILVKKLEEPRVTLESLHLPDTWMNAPGQVSHG